MSKKVYWLDCQKTQLEDDSSLLTDIKFLTKILKSQTLSTIQVKRLTFKNNEVAHLISGGKVLAKMEIKS